MMSNRFRRCIACMLVLALCLGSVAEPFRLASALADVYLPAGLTALDDEAFLGDYKLDGVLELPGKVSDLGVNVFSGTQLYAIIMPESVVSIPAQGLDGVAYIRLEGVTTQADPGAFTGVSYVFGSCQSAAKEQAIADGARFICTGGGCTCTAKLVEADGFYFLCEDGSATLLCAVDCTTMSGTVTVPAALPDGTEVTTMASTAMMRCDGVTMLRLPLGITEETGCLDGSPNAVVTYYSDDEFYVTSIRANQDSVRPGTDVTWIARTNSSGAVEYYFEVLKQESRQLTLVSRSDGFRSSLLYEDSNCYTTQLAEPGTYIARVICRDESGAECTASAEQVVVLSPDLSMSGVTSSASAVLVGESITWTVSTTGGNGTILYSYTLMHNGTVIDTVVNAAEATYTVDAAQEGEYVLIARVMDDRVQLASQRAETVMVYTEAAARPAAPELINTTLSTAEASAPVMEAGNIALEWTAVPYAAQYGVTVALHDGSDWVEVHHATINGSKTSYTVSAALFADITAQTACRIGLYSTNLEPGDSRYYYAQLTPRVIDTSLTINGASTVYWYEGYHGAATKSFTINSELPFTVTPKTGGDWYTYTVNDNLLTISLSENNLGSYVDDRLSISNGTSTATLRLRHYCLTRAPLLVSPAGSTLSAPAQLTMDPVYLEFEDNDCSFDLYIERQTGDGWEVVWSETKPDDSLLFCARDAGLAADTLYRVRLVGYIRDLAESVQKDALVSYAYLMFSDVADSVSFNGAAEHSISIGGSSAYYVVLSYTGDTPVITSDADWLTAAMDDETSLKVTPTENTTASPRTGHITVTCGSASAVLTVVQASNLPVLLLPAELSATESSPTTIYLQEDLGWNSLRAQCETLTLSVLENGAYTEVTSDTDDSACYIALDYADALTDVTYRLSLTRGSTTLHYYLTFDESSYYIYVDDDDSRSKEIAAEGGSATVTLRTNGTWTASCSDSWLSVSAASGSKTTAGKTITITAAANNTGVMRKGAVTFQRGSYQTATVIVTQYPVPTALSLAWDLMETAGVTGGAAGGEYLYIDTAGDWTASVSDSWIGFNSSCTTKSKTGTGVDEFKVYVTELPSGSAPRTATVTVTAGAVTKTIELTQLPLVAAKIISPIFSEDKSAPTIFEHDDLVVTWQGDEYASYYTLRSQVEDYDGSVATNYQTIPADGSSTYSVTVPQDWMLPDSGYVCRFTLYGVDTAGNTFTQVRYFQVVSGDGVFIDGKVSKSLYEASDLGDSATYTITSTGTWTASPSHDWIKVDKASGATDEELTVTLSKNYGEERDGAVTISCGDNSAVLKVNQCAYIPDKPQLKDCALSLDMANPAVLPSDTSSLTVNWDKEEQPTYYQLRLYEVHSTDLKQHSHAYGRDDTLIASGEDLDPRDRTYTFEGLSLTPGALYMLDFYRTISDKRSGKTHYYFMAATDGTPYVYIYDEDLAVTEEYYSTEDYGMYDITSNGTWRAVSDSDWLMVGDERYTWTELLEEDSVPSDYNTYTAMGDTLYVSLLANDSGKTRTGHITLSIPGGKSAVLTIVQPRSCTAATLVSPALTDDKTNPVTLPYQDLTFRWNASPDGAGKYTVTLRERLPDETRYYAIYDETTTGTSLTIPVDEFTQDADYILYLDTWVDSEYTVRKSYRFHMNFLNALSATADVDWQDGYVYVTAYASGGSGTGYKYSFALRRNGAIENNSLWHDAQNEYSFTFSGAGTYQMEVYVSDSLGQEQSFIVSEHIVGETAVEKYISLDPATWTADAAGGETTIAISANDAWHSAVSADWLHVSAEDDTSAQAVVTAAANTTGAARVGTITFTCGTAQTTLAVNQPAAAQVDDGSSISLDLTSWVVTSDSASSTTLDVSASGSWVVAAYPAWITLSAVNGEGDATLSLYAAPNTGASREGTLDFVCGSASASLTVQQIGTDTLPVVTAFEMSETTVSTGVDVTFTVTAADADSVILVVDGTQHEEYPLTDGSGTFTRSFSSSGERSVQLLPVRGTTQGLLSAAQTLTVTSKGSLASPALAELAPVIIGCDALVSWNAIPNAENYVIYISYGGLQIWKTTLEADQTSCTIPASVLSANGSYTCLVMATATGYKQSESGMFIDVVTPQVTFNVAFPTASSVYIPKDTVDIQVDNPSGYNIAVKVTDEEGNVTYLPEDGSTVNDTYIKGKLLYSPMTTGKVTVQAMAWPTEKRTADSAAWYDTRRNVTFTVNGPIARMIYLGNTSTASSMLTTSLTTLSVKTNNAVTKVSVELDGTPLTVTKNGQSVTTITAWDSEVDYIRTFSCDLPAATEGLHRYTVVASDDEGRTHRRTYTLYVVTPASADTLYAQSRGVLLRTTPATTAENAESLKYSTALTVIGSYTDATLGKLWYVTCSQGKGYVVASEVGTTKHDEYEDVYFVTGHPLNGAADYNDSSRSLIYAWECSIDLPAGATYRLYKRAESGTAWQLVTETTSYMPSISASTLGTGTWKIAVALHANGNDYGWTEFPDYTRIFDDASTYLIYMQTFYPDDQPYTQLMRCVSTTYDSMVIAHEIFTVGATINGKYYPPADTRDMVEEGAFQFYYNVFGDGLPVEDEMLLQLSVVDSIMNELAPSADDLGGEKAYKQLCKVLDNIEDLDDVVKAIKEVADLVLNEENESLAWLAECTDLINVNGIDEFSNAKDKVDIALNAINAVIMAVRYSMVDDAELTKIANGFLKSKNSTMQDIGEMLLEMRSIGNVVAYSFSMFEFEVAKFLKGQISDMVKKFISKLGWVGKLYMAVVNGATAFNELSFNTNATQNAAIKNAWAIDATDAYLSTFKQAMTDFKQNPLKNYDHFVLVCETYLRLLRNEYTTFCDFCDTVNSAGWSRLKGIFSNKDEQMKASVERNRGFVEQLRWYMNWNLDDMYNDCLVKFGLTYDPVDK